MKKTLVLLSLILMVCAVGFLAASKVLGFPLFGLAASGSQEKDPKTAVISLGQMITNLSDPGRFIRLTVDVEVEARRSQEFTARMSEVKTDIYALLRSKSYLELTGENGLRNLQKEIKDRLDAKWPGSVRNVFFSEFIVQ